MMCKKVIAQASHRLDQRRNQLQKFSRKGRFHIKYAVITSVVFQSNSGPLEYRLVRTLNDQLLRAHCNYFPAQL